MILNRFAKYAWFVLIFNLAVILWGAFVRATGSGAGCGNHWPLCNGVVVPRAERIETMIEFAHRISSGLALLFVIGLFIWAFRAYPKGHVVRLGAQWTIVFIITESLVGAGLVLFKWVAQDVSIGRVISISVHLINTFMLLAAISLTAWWASGGERIMLRGQGIVAWLFLIAIVGVVFLGVSGAITALGDTLFPSSTLAEGLAADVSPTAHFLVRLRVWHPLIAVLNGIFLLFLAGLIAMFRVSMRIRRLCSSLAGLFVVQLMVGITNVLLLAPVWMQLIHLLLADLTWIALVLLSAANFGESELRHRKVEPKPVSSQKNGNGEAHAAAS